MYNIGRFIGLRNRSKVKTWIYLQYLKDNNKRGATIREIHNFTGVPLRTLENSLNKWWSWNRLHKHLLDKPAPDGSKYLWSIAASGSKYLTDTVPVGFNNECVTEINEYQAARKAAYLKYAGVAWRVLAGYHVIHYNGKRHELCKVLPCNILLVKSPAEAYSIVVEVL
jgi:hypothetical protein